MRPASCIGPVAFILFCTLGLACSSPSAPVVEPVVTLDPKVAVAPRITPNPTLPARAYTDGTGTVLEFVPVKVRDVAGVHAIIRLSGVGKPYEGRPMLAKRAFLDDGGNDWRVMADGRMRTIIIVSKKRLGTSEMVLDLGGRSRRRIMVSHDADSSRYVDSAKLLAAHRQVVESGEAARFESVNREHHVARGMLAMESQQEELDAGCGGSIPIEIAWNDMPNEMVGPQHYCNSLVQIVSKLCTRNENTKADINARLSKIRCLAQTEEGSVALASEGVLQVHPPKTRRGFVLKALRARMIGLLGLKKTVLRSKAGTHVVLDHEQFPFTAVHAGWAPNLHRQFVTSNSTPREIFLWNADLDVEFRRTAPDKWVAACPGQETEFSEVSVEERDRVLKTATLGKRMWRHEQMALARDRSTYYYVDQLTAEEGKLGYRLFKGPRGAVKQVQLQDVITDPVSVTFIAARSQLEVRLERGDVVSVTLGKGKRTRPLQLLSLGVAKNRSLVYHDLGAYDGEVLGGICDLGAGDQP